MDLFGHDPTVLVVLNDFERKCLSSHPSNPPQIGGFQSLMIRFQNNIHEDGSLRLTPDDLRRINRYANNYKGGGWQNDLRAIFQRHLGRNLDKVPAT
jgi:hypothetical protein